MYQKPVNIPSNENKPEEPPPPTNRAIFRSEAREHYIRNQAKVELPRLISMKLFRYLWLIALLLLAAGSIIAFWPFLEQIR